MNPITEKIRKLLNLGRDGAATPNEAALAMAKAQQLAAQHGISLTEIPADGDAGSWLTHITTKSRRDLANRLAQNLVQTHFGVRCCFQWNAVRSVIHIVGTRDQAEIATYVYIYLYRSLNRGWARRKNRRLRDRESFMSGFAYAISQQLPEVFPQTGLVLSTAHYIETQLIRPGMTVRESPPPKDRVSPAALLSGYRAGKSAGIRNAISAPSFQPELPLG